MADNTQRSKAGRAHPKSLVRFIMEAIDEVAPGQGAAVYWRAFRRYEKTVARERREAEEKSLRQTMG